MSDLELAAQPSLVTAAGAIRDAVEAMKAYRELCQALLEPSDFQQVGSTQFKKKSAWRKLALAFNVSVREVSHEYVRDPETGLVVFAEFVMQAKAPNGRTMDGVGACSLSERDFAHQEHDIIATASTRATNRACADLFGMGEVTAEEVGNAAARRAVTATSRPRGKYTKEQIEQMRKASAAPDTEQTPDDVHDDTPELRGLGPETQPPRYDPPDDSGRPFE